MGGDGDHRLVARNTAQDPAPDLGPVAAGGAVYLFGESEELALANASLPGAESWRDAPHPPQSVIARCLADGSPWLTAEITPESDEDWREFEAPPRRPGNFVPRSVTKVAIRGSAGASRADFGRLSARSESDLSGRALSLG